MVTMEELDDVHLSSDSEDEVSFGKGNIFIVEKSFLQDFTLKDLIVSFGRKNFNSLIKQVEN